MRSPTLWLVPASWERRQSESEALSHRWRRPRKYILYWQAFFHLTSSSPWHPADTEGKYLFWEWILYITSFLEDDGLLDILFNVQWSLPKLRFALGFTYNYLRTLIVYASEKKKTSFTSAKQSLLLYSVVFRWVLELYSIRPALRKSNHFHSHPTPSRDIPPMTQ